MADAGRAFRFPPPVFLRLLTDGQNRSRASPMRRGMRSGRSRDEWRSSALRGGGVLAARGPLMLTLESRRHVDDKAAANNFTFKVRPCIPRSRVSAR